MQKTICAFLLIFLFQSLLKAQSGTRVSFNKDWKFFLGNSEEILNPDFDDSKWRKLNLPHDWSIEGKFDRNNPAGTGGGALPGGIGWYRKTFTLPTLSRNKNLFIEFDGIYWKSTVWINGHRLGNRPNGYISFRYDLTPYLKYGSDKNILIVQADNADQPNSRWYSGSGIYRNVWLVSTHKIHIGHWGTQVSTPVIQDNKAIIAIKTEIQNDLSAISSVTLKTTVYNEAGMAVATSQTGLSLTANGITQAEQRIEITTPHLWSVADPHLYQIVSQIIRNKQVIDRYVTTTGIRSFEFDVNRGFILNGKRIKINGVCDHHDLGCLGSALNRRALQRQLEILKAMGCNGIRTSHNPPAPELLDLCDEMGFIVMDEAFDMWRLGKNKFDYHLDWDAWHLKDLEDQVKRDRNHPSVFIWSIGNEIMEQWAKDNSGARIAHELRQIVRALDTTRPITSALNDHDMDSNDILQSGALDLVGYNYAHQDYPAFLQKLPGKKFIGTETVSALETRGSYDMPSDSIRRWPMAWDKPLTNGNADLSCSAYDNLSTPWGSTHEETWKIIKKYDFLSGQYIWTGFDYLGEPTPYPWPARSSYFGIIDLAGFPKDVYYMYQSEWSDKPVLHIFPHWNWAKGKTVDIWAYYSQADEVELLLNGQSLGVRKKLGEELHVMWRVQFEQGTLKAISRKNGQIVLSREIRTAGKAAAISLQADRNKIKADGSDLSFITARVVDEEGNTVPGAEDLIRFTTSGPGKIKATDNGSQTSLESFQSPDHHAFHGLCLAVIQSTSVPGNITLTASANGLKPATITLAAE